MRRRRILIAATAAAAVAAAAASASAPSGIALTPVGRLPFPERGFVVDFPKGVESGSLHAVVRENGSNVSGVQLVPVSASNVTFGVVLAIDASDSMTGRPSAAALEAARTFVAHRIANERIGVVTFNDRVVVRQQPSADSARLGSTLSAPLNLAYGTHIYDAVMRSFAVLEASHVSSGSVVLLSDGADIGSSSKLTDVVARAARDHFRVFTVGLRSGAYDAKTLQQLAAGTGGVYTEAASAADLGRIYRALSGRLANEYLLQYRSNARPGERVQVTVDIATLGRATAAYVTPTASGLAPFHRSPITRFMLSGASVVILTLLVAGLVAFVLRLLLRRPDDSLLERMGTFVSLRQEGSPVKQVTQAERARRVRAAARPSSAFGRWRARLATDFEIAEISIAPSTFLLATLVLTLLAAVALLLISPPFVLLAVLVPVFARAWVSKKVGAVRFAFEQQLPETLQVLASALRSGHSFFGALGLVVDSCSQPSRREFRQVLTDDQLGIPVEEALRHVAVRMASRDMEQVALLGELQRTAGGNSAEVLDTVVETIRERTDLRRLAHTLTAQGRMARWILSFLPPVVALFLWITRPDLIDPLFQSKNGQIALAVTALMSVAGSFWIKQIVNIKV